MTMSPIEPGHAVGHLRTVAGVPITITVTGTAPGGGQVTFSTPVTPDR